MVKSRKSSKQTTIKIDPKPSPANEQKPFAVQDGTYFFISYDVVNSTRLKSLCPEWRDAISSFYEEVRKLNSSLLEASIWKYIGDEVVMYKNICDLGSICDTLLNAFEALNILNKAMKAWECNSINRNLLAVKGTVWCASVESVGTNSRNIGLPLKTSVLEEGKGLTEQDNLDFIGPDIDIGFRIAKFATRGRMVVSSDLALLVHNCITISKDRDKPFYKEMRDKMRIVSLENLKGVWHDRPYPIVWYENNWNQVDDSFEYDEYISSTIIRGLKDKEAKQIQDLEKIYKDSVQSINVTKMLENLQNTSVKITA